MPSMATTHEKHATRDTRSALVKLLEKDGDPREILACPFGCGVDDQDALGYCKHLVGFTNATIPEGDVTAATRIPADAVVEMLAEPDVILQRRSVARGHVCKIQVGDHLVRITSSSRVYRREPPKAPAAFVPKRRSTSAPTPAPAG